MVYDASGGANGVAVENRHHQVIDKCCTQFFGRGNALIGSSLNQGNKPSTSPGENVSFSFRSGNLLHVRSKVCGSCRCKDVIGNKFTAKLGTGVAESSRRTMAKGIVSSQLDELVVLLG